MNSNKDMTIKFTDVDVTGLKFTELQENTRSKGQKISYPRYTNPKDGSEMPLFIQFPWINLKSYGVPKIGEYYSDDTQRSFVKVPLDQSIPEIKQLSDFIIKLDEEMSSEKFKLHMFGTKASKYHHQPIFRIPPEEDDDTINQNKKNYGPKHPYMKLKIDTTFPDNEVKTIIFDSVVKDGVRVRTKINNVKTIDDFASHICWMSRIHPVVRPVKLWAQAPNKKDPTYGITFKIAKTEVESPNKTNSNFKEFLESDVFLESDDDNITKPVSKKVIALSCDDESDDESDEEVTKPVTKKVIAMDDDDESDEEVTKPVTKKVIAMVDDDDSDESDEEVKPAKKPTKASTAKASSKTKKSYT
jgi:hypothetical protein